MERGADLQLHMAHLMPLPLTVSCFSKIQIGFTFLVPAHLGSPGQRASKLCVCVCEWTALPFYDTLAAQHQNLVYKSRLMVFVQIMNEITDKTAYTNCCMCIYRVGQKNRTVFRLDNFVTVSPKKACSMSKFSNFYREKRYKTCISVSLNILCQICSNRHNS